MRAAWEDSAEAESPRPGRVAPSRGMGRCEAGSGTELLGRYSFQLPDLPGGLRPPRDQHAADDE